MNDEDTIFVRAGDGRVVLFHGSDAPLGSLPGLRLNPGDPPIEVPNTTGNRRSILDGDLVAVKRHTFTMDADVPVGTLAERVESHIDDFATGPIAKK